MTQNTSNVIDQSDVEEEGTPKKTMVVMSSEIQV